MSRKNRKSRNDLTIDLTSLLDVIFIILLAVMVGQKDASAQEQQDLDALQADAVAQIAQAENAQQLYEDMLDTQNNLSKYVYAVSITVPYDKDEIHKREIMLLTEGSDPQTFPLIGNETAESLAAFKESLAGSIADHTDCPVILSLNDDDEKILYRDEKAVSGILYEISAEYDNVYIKGNLSEVAP